MSPLVEGRLWDDRDVPVSARMNEGVHLHGALAGIELSHTGPRDACLYSREVPIAVEHTPVYAGNYPVQARAMDQTAPELSMRDRRTKRSPIRSATAMLMIRAIQAESPDTGSRKGGNRPAMPKGKKKNTLRESVYGSLKAMIVTGQLSLGARLTENELATKLKVSRTPVREALNRLERDD